MSAARGVRGALAAVVVAGLCGCALDPDTPDRSCRTDADCFVAQGERCDVEARVCSPPDGPDAGAGLDPATPGEATPGEATPGEAVRP